MANNYNYMEAMTEDIRTYINNNITLSDFSDRDELEEHLYDTLFVEDSVTGNASGATHAMHIRQKKISVTTWICWPMQ